MCTAAETRPNAQCRTFDAVLCEAQQRMCKPLRVVESHADTKLCYALRGYGTVLCQIHRHLEGMVLSRHSSLLLGRVRCECKKPDVSLQGPADLRLQLRLGKAQVPVYVQAASLCMENPVLAWARNRRISNLARCKMFSSKMSCQHLQANPEKC
jgi:hypothetical protein